MIDLTGSALARDLREAVGLVIESNGLLAEHELGRAKVIRERLRLPA